MNDYTTTVFLAILSSSILLYYIHKINPNVPPIIMYIILPIIFTYVFTIAIGAVLPHINHTTAKWSAYGENQLLGGIYDMNYLQVFPPLMLVILLTFIVIFSTNK